MRLENQTTNQIRKNKLLLFAKIAALLLLFLIISSFLIKDYLSQEAVTNREKESLPSPVKIEQPIVDKTPIESKTPIQIKSELNLDVPFTSQAPHANWDQVHEEACEEAAILMARRYFNNQAITSADDAEGEIQEIIAWEKENLGFFESTTVNETVRIIEEFSKLNAEILRNPTEQKIKQALNDNKLVLVPAAGRELGNPFYKSPGPLYHFLVIKGYTDRKFITNDPGTKRGENYSYDFETILSANHDWNGGDVLNGQKMMILVTK